MFAAIDDKFIGKSFCAKLEWSHVAAFDRITMINYLCWRSFRPKTISLFCARSEHHIMNELRKGKFQPKSKSLSTAEILDVSSKRSQLIFPSNRTEIVIINEIYPFLRLSPSSSSIANLFSQSLKLILFKFARDFLTFFLHCRGCCLNGTKGRVSRI